MSASEHAFQFTPFGVIPIGAPVPETATDHVAGANPYVAPPVERVQVPDYRTALPTAATNAKPAGPLTGKQIAAQCKARIKELDKALAAVPAMQAERTYLRQLLAAAAAKGKKGLQ